MSYTDKNGNLKPGLCRECGGSGQTYDEYDHTAVYKCDSCKGTGKERPVGTQARTMINAFHSDPGNPDNPTYDPDRRVEMFWVVTDNQVVQSPGYDCGTPEILSNYGMWWFPKLGFSAKEGHHCFRTEWSARNALALELAEKASEISRRIKENTDATFRAARTLDTSQRVW